MKEKQFYKSTRFWTMAFGMILPIINSTFGLGLNLSEIIASITSGATYIAGQSYKDSVKIKADVMRSE